MTKPVRNSLQRLLMAALAAAPLLAGAAAGAFTFVTGEVSLTKANGQRVTPAKGTPIDPGDRIATGPNGMAQLTMVDNARLSLRPATQFQIEAYPQQADSTDGAILSLVKGTLRTFTGLLASGNRDKFVMRTRVATVGIRGSGNILYACDGAECDASVATPEQAQQGVTVNHTIEGSHSVTNIVTAQAGVPAQQGGATTLITGPGQTVLVAGNQPPRYIPTPRFISDAANNPASKATVAASATAGEGGGASTRNFSPSDTPALPAALQQTTPVVGNNGLGFASDIDATANLSADPLQLHDIVIVAGSPFFGQAREARLVRENNVLRSYTSYPETGAGLQPSISGGTLRDSQFVSIGGLGVAMGRYENASIGFFGSGSSPLPGSIHFIYAGSGYPTYLSDVLTGSVTYTLAAATAPTNQSNTAGTLGSASLGVNFSNRTMGFAASVSLPAAGTNAGGTWQLAANDVPFSLNSFFASTSDRLVINNGTENSTHNPHLTGSFEGSLVGTGLGAAILGYGISDRTSGSDANWNFVSGVAAFRGPPQQGGASYREGRVSDPNETLTDTIRTYATTDRSDEVVSDAAGRVTAFSAAYQGFGSHANYAIGSSQVVQSGLDAETGLVWGRWAGGVATVSKGGQSFNIPLQQASLHYIFAGPQAGPVALPLTGTAAYDVIGSTSPTNGGGAVGTLGSATLSANFTMRTVDASVNIAIANQTWTGAASGMPIYREQYFSAYSGMPIPGLPNPAPLVIGCSPSCGAGAGGSFDGFFAGRNGSRAGLIYNLGGNQGVVAFGRHGG